MSRGKSRAMKQAAFGMVITSSFRTSIQKSHIITSDAKKSREIPEMQEEIGNSATKEKAHEKSYLADQKTLEKEKHS